MTEPLSGAAVSPVDMEADQVAHLAGVFDAAGSFTTHVYKRDNGPAIGYEFHPQVILRRPADDQIILGKLDAYCEDYGIQYGLSEQESKDLYIFEVRRPDSIRRFIEPMMPYLVIQQQEAVLMLEEIVPRVENGDHLEKAGLVELMEYADKIRESARHGSGPKYTKSYFEELWEDDLS